MMHIRDVCWENGGATFCHSILSGQPYSTNHQVVFVPKSRTLWIRTPDKDWQRVELGPLFGMSNEKGWGALKREVGIV